MSTVSAPSSGLPALAAARPGVVVGSGRYGDPGGAGRARALADRERDLQRGPATAGVVVADVDDRPRQTHRVAREDRVVHAERHLAEPAERAGPVGDVALE